jgi:hypothetical protein
MLASALLGCAEFTQPVPPGHAIKDRPGHGLVFGRIAVIRDGEDRMMSLPSFPRSFGWELLQADTGKKFVVDPLTENGLFALPLPPGLYHVTKLRYEDRYGLWEGSLPASFVVKPTGSTYVGTWEIVFAGVVPAVTITGQAVNDLQEERAEFNDHYQINSRTLHVALLESAMQGRLSLLRPRAEQ